MRKVSRVLLVAAVLAVLPLGAGPAGADTVPGVTAAPFTVSPGDPLTVSGPFFSNLCVMGSVTVTSGGGPVYRLGPRVSMLTAWTVTAQEFTLQGASLEFPTGAYTVGIECFDDRGNQQVYDTPATFTVAPLPSPDPNAYKPLTPARLLDTRPGGSTVDTQAAGAGAVGPDGTLTFTVTNRGGVPSTDVKAVVLNITATGPTSGGFLTVFPSGEAKPNASSLNFGPGQTVPNLVVAKVGAGGQVSIYNALGSTHLIADVTGWFPASAAFTPVSPARLFDSRTGGSTVDGVGAGGGAVGLGGVRSVRVTGRGGVPATDVAAVVLNVTATAPTGPSFLTAYPAGEARPLASNLNFVTGQTVANQVVARVGSGGQVNLYNEAGATHLIVDVAGWFPTAAAFTSLSPARLLDTRVGGTTIDAGDAGGGALGPGIIRSLKVTGRGGVPASRVSAVILNVTATSPTGAGYVTAYPAGEPRPVASNLNFAPGQTTPNLVVAKVGAGGRVLLYNEAGSTHLLADVAGWFDR